MFSRPRWLVRLAWAQAVRLRMPGRLFAPVALAIAVSILAPAARAATIATFPAGSAGFATSNSAVGQSVTTPGGGPWSGITFNFYDISSNPYANGSLYLLDHEYLGTPANLSSQTSLGVGTAGGGTWTFDPSLVLQSSTQYWFYMDTSSGATSLLYGTGDPYAAGALYRSSGGTASYAVQSTQDSAFLLQGTQAAPGPLPGAGLLSYLVVGCGGAVAFGKKLRARVAALFAILKGGESCSAA